MFFPLSQHRQNNSKNSWTAIDEHTTLPVYHHSIITPLHSLHRLPFPFPGTLGPVVRIRWFAPQLFLASPHNLNPSPSSILQARFYLRSSKILIRQFVARSAPWRFTPLSTLSYRSFSRMSAPNPGMYCSRLAFTCPPWLMRTLWRLTELCCSWWATGSHEGSRAPRRWANEKPKRSRCDEPRGS